MHKPNLSTKKGPNSPPPVVPVTLWEGRAKQIIYDIYSSTKSWMFLHILPSCRQQNRQKERLAKKARNKLCDLGGFVEQQRGMQWQNLKSHLYRQEILNVPRCTCPCRCPNFPHNQTRLSIFWRLCCAAAPGVAQTVRRCSSFVLKLEVFISLQTFSSLCGYGSFFKDKGEAKLSRAHRLLHIKINRRFLM